MNLIEIHFDGGCRPTNPGNKYGSFEVQLDKKQVCLVSRMELGWGTSNEAEFDILIEALRWTFKQLCLGGFSPSLYEIRLFTDSTIVANRIKNRNCQGKSEPAKRMGNLTRQCLAKLGVFGLWSIQWNGRASNVERFGH